MFSLNRDIYLVCPYLNLKFKDNIIYGTEGATFSPPIIIGIYLHMQTTIFVFPIRLFVRFDSAIVILVRFFFSEWHSFFLPSEGIISHWEICKRIWMNESESRLFFTTLIFKSNLHNKKLCFIRFYPFLLHFFLFTLKLIWVCGLTINTTILWSYVNLKFFGVEAIHT